MSDKQRRLKLLDFLSWVNGFEKSNCFICGDSNVHWEAPNVSKSAIWNWCQDFGFEQIINEPTRYECILDLCFCRSTDKRITSMNIELPFSDHKGIIFNIG